MVEHVNKIIALIGIIILFSLVIFTSKSSTNVNSSNLPDAAKASEEIQNGAPGTLLYKGVNRQRLRMWEELHHMEWWLMHQKNIRIERIYSIPLSGNFTIGRYYVQYMEE